MRSGCLLAATRCARANFWAVDLVYLRARSPASSSHEVCQIHSLKNNVHLVALKGCCHHERLLGCGARRATVRDEIPCRLHINTDERSPRHAQIFAYQHILRLRMCMINLRDHSLQIRPAFKIVKHNKAVCVCVCVSAREREFGTDYQS